MKSFGLWLMSVTVLSLTLGCGEKKKEEPAVPATPPADAPAEPAAP